MNNNERPRWPRQPYSQGQAQDGSSRPPIPPTAGHAGQPSFPPYTEYLGQQPFDEAGQQYGQAPMFTQAPSRTGMPA